MEFELTIAGLCLLVDDTAKGVVHVIMPATAMGGDTQHAQHNARFVHPAASGAASDLIDGYHFDLTALAVPAADRLVIPDAVLDMATVCATADRIIDAIITASDPRKSVHVVLRGGSFTTRMPECCIIDGRQEEHSGQITWKITMRDPNASLIGNALAGKAAPRTIRPHPSGAVLRVGLVNSTANDMPETLEDLDKVRRSNFQHFAAFHPLFERSCTLTPQACEESLLYPSQCMIVRTTR